MKERLRRYSELLAEIEIKERRLEALEAAEGYGASRARSTIASRLHRLREEEDREHRALVEIINGLAAPQQRQVLFARYVDRHAWGDVAQLLFGRKPDYWLRKESYERRVYRLHGEALSNLNRLVERS